MIRRSLLFAAIVASALSISAAETSAPQIVGHRGASFYAPENTIPSYELAWKQNADAIELDIHLSTDKKLIVMHDPTTSRTAQGQNLAIVESDSATLRKLDVGEFKGAQYKGTRIPFLEEVFNIVPAGKQVYVEIKVSGPKKILSEEKKVLPELVEQLKKAVDKFGHPERIVVISFDFRACVLTHKAMPELPVYWLIGAKEKGQKVTRLIPDAYIAKAKKANLTGLDVESPALDATVIKKIHDAGMKTVCWTVDDPAEVARMTNLGVAGITTNKPDTTRAAMENALKK